MVKNYIIQHFATVRSLLQAAFPNHLNEFKKRIIYIFISYCTAVKNVLFLVVDDLRAQLGAYQGSGCCFPSSISPTMITPNMDKLARKSLLLKRAYVQQALCSPSRTSVMTGRRPDTTHVYDLESYWRTVGGNFTTLPQYFKQNGYLSVGMGKIYHQGSASGNGDPDSWSEPFWDGVANFERRGISWRSIKDGRLNNMSLIDEQIADRAVEVMLKASKDAKSGDKPFFLAVGFHKPHLPFVVPESYLNKYPEANISLPNNAYAPIDMPEVAWQRWAELRAYQDIADLGVSGDINATLPDATVKALRRAYYAAITWVDHQIGRVVDELTTLGLEKDTVIALWGDHGFQLGEHGGWCKQTNFELTTHAPMMIHIPGQTDLGSAGIISEQLVEFVDLFPTIVEAAGLGQVDLCPVDSSNTQLCREGLSLVPLIMEPDKALKNASFSQSPKNNNQVMGYTMRTNQYRYTEWVDFDKASYTPLWNNVLQGVELYDHFVDADENYNKASDPKYSSVKVDLNAALRSGWRNAIL